MRMATSSYQVEHPLGDARSVALRAAAADDQRVPGGVEVLLPAHFTYYSVQRRALKFDHLAALPTLKVLVLRVAVIVLVAHPRPDFELAEQTGIDELG